MRIAIISKLWETTSPQSQGGTGAAVGNLVNELVEEGHRVTLFATGDSRTKAQRLVAAKKQPYKNDYSEVIEYQHIAAAFQRAKEFDLIHCHVEHKSLIFAGLVKTPTLHTIRYGEFFSDELALLKKYRHLNFAGNSQALKRLLPFIKFKGIVHNSLNLKNFPFNNQPKNYLLFLSRLSPQKGVDQAIKLAKQIKLPLILAGKIVERDKQYLQQKVIKYIDGQQIKYLGYVGFKQKINLLRNALALIHPNTFFEACSNVILEAQACGTPVLAYDRGGNKEIVKNQVTGFVVKNFNQLVAASKKIPQVNRLACRRWIEKKFSNDQIADKWLKVYKKIP